MAGVCADAADRLTQSNPNEVASRIVAWTGLNILVSPGIGGRPGIFMAPPP
jgi:hypothetical protein